MHYCGFVVELLASHFAKVKLNQLTIYFRLS